MNKTFVVTCLFVVGLGQAQDKSVNSENVIQWQEAYRIQVEDFQKKQKPDERHAFTAYKIEFYPSDVIVDLNDYIQGYENLTVVAEFHMDKSHFNPDYTADLLIHEQLTFDIAELFARKIRKRFDELKQSKERRFSAYNYEYNVLWRACKQYQLDFNKATNSGWNSTDEVATWKAKIDQELKVLQLYAIKPL